MPRLEVASKMDGQSLLNVRHNEVVKLQIQVCFSIM